jgi:ATP synthase protein I
MPFNPPIPEQNKPRVRSEGLNAVMQTEKAIQMGLLPPSAVALCWIIGAWADRQFHQHWIAIAGIVFGAVAGLTGVIRMVLASEKSSRGGNSGNGNPPL